MKVWKSKALIVMLGVFILMGCGKNDLQEGKAYFRTRQTDKAIDSFTKAIHSNPQEQEAYFFRGATFSARGQFDQALGDYSKVLELNAQHADAYWSRGYCYQNKKLDDKAIADYTKSLSLGTKMEPLVYELRAGAYFRKAMLNEAEKDLRSALRFKPRDPKILRGLEDIKKAKADPSFGPHALKFRPLEEQPQDGEAPLSPAVKSANDQFLEEVTREFGTKERAFEDVLKRARTLYGQGDYSTSMKRLNQAWLLDGDNPDVFRGYSLVLRAWGYNNEADKWGQKAKAGGKTL